MRISKRIRAVLLLVTLSAGIYTPCLTVDANSLQDFMNSSVINGSTSLAMLSTSQRALYNMTELALRDVLKSTDEGVIQDILENAASALLDGSVQNKEQLVTYLRKYLVMKVFSTADRTNILSKLQESNTSSGSTSSYVTDTYDANTVVNALEPLLAKHLGSYANREPDIIARLNVLMTKTKAASLGDVKKYTIQAVTDIIPGAKGMQIASTVCSDLVKAVSTSGSPAPNQTSASVSSSNSYPRPGSFPNNLPVSNDGVIDPYLSMSMPDIMNSNDHADDRMQSYPHRLAALLDAVRSNMADSAKASTALIESINRTTFQLSGYSASDVSLPTIYRGNISTKTLNGDMKLTAAFTSDMGYLCDSAIYDDAYYAAINTALEMCYYAHEYRDDLENRFGSDIDDLSALAGSDVDTANLSALYEACENINANYMMNGIAVPLIQSMWEYKVSGELSLRDYAQAIGADQWHNLMNTVSSVYERDVEQPLSAFYTVGFKQEDLSEAVFSDFIDTTNSDINIQLSDNIIKGISYSSTYVPMQTNLYAADTLAGYDNNWLRDFHYKYGFMRKALFKSTSSTAAMDLYNTNNTVRGATEICTLKDLLKSNGHDIVLYIDTNFYNENAAAEQAAKLLESRKDKLSAMTAKLSDYIERLLEAEIGLKSDVREVLLDVQDDEALSMLGSQYSTTVNDLAGVCVDVNNTLELSYDEYSWESVLKGEGYTSYNDKLRAAIAAINKNGGDYISDADSATLTNNNVDSLCLPSSEIDAYLNGVTIRVESNEAADTDSEVTTYDEYTPMLSYAYVSGVYRDAYDYSISSSSLLNTPVFIASDDLCGIEEAEKYYKNSLLNYMLLQNLDTMSDINYVYSLDMESPVYMDIYGNIVTESGIVVIPAASNATLFLADYNSILGSMGLFTAYGNDYYVPVTLQGSESVLSDMFIPDSTSGEYWLIDGYSYQVDGHLIDYANMSSYSADARNAAMMVFSTYLMQESGSTHCVGPAYLNIINEVMRGAPIGYFDVEEEYLLQSSFTGKSAVAAAAKLESLIESLNSAIANTLLVIPDFSTMEHTEFIVGFCFKLLIAAVIIVVIVAIYRDAVSSTLGIHTLKQALGAVALTFIAVAVIPAVFQLTYYTANKLLLQDEVTRIAMYNLEKKEGGTEIGVTALKVPEDNNKLMVQLDWVSVPWYRQMEHMMFNDSIKNISIAREEAFQSSGVALQSDVTRYNDGVYMSTDDIFDSVGLDYTFLTDEVTELDSGQITNGLYVYSKGTEQTLSFYAPYYVFLYGLTANINSYNYMNENYNYTTKMQSGNRYKTVGLSADYFRSISFMEDYDPLHLYEIYGITPSDRISHVDIYTLEEKLNMRSSVWYNPLKSDDLEKRIAICTNYCRDFIADNRDLLDKVSDETFIKVMALTMSMKYNQVFGVTTANCYEIYNIDSNDLLRMCLADTSDVMLSSPLSYARFVMTYGGEAGVYAAAVLVMIMYAGSFIKPACVLISFIAVFLSIFIYKVVLRRANMSIYGYFITVAALSATNLLHALILKVSTWLPKLGLSLFWCCVFMTLMQIAYLMMLAYVTGTALIDFQDLGFNRYKSKYDRLVEKNSSTDKLNGNVPCHQDNKQYLDDLYKQHRERGGSI